MNDYERMALYESALRTKKYRGGFSTMATQMLPISAVKLGRELSKKKISARQISTEMGYQEDYISNAFGRGTIAKSAALLLEKLYDIQYDEIAPETNKPTPEEPENASKSATLEIDYKRLYDTVFEAVYQGVKKAWENE